MQSGEALEDMGDNSSDSVVRNDEGNGGEVLSNEERDETVNTGSIRNDENVNNDGNLNIDGNEGSSTGGEVPMLIHSELLCFMNCYAQSCSPDNIEKAVLCFYTLDQVKEAKDNLWNKLSDKLREYRRRKATPSRSGEEAHLLTCLKHYRSLWVFRNNRTLQHQ